MKRNMRAVFHLKKLNEMLTVGGVLVMSLTMSLILVFLGEAKEVANSFGYCFLAFMAGGYFVINLFLKVFAMADEVIKGLTFGMTRRNLFAYSRVYDFAEILVITILAVIILREFNPMIFKVAALCFGVFMWLEGIAGNSIIRYGKIAYWVYYILIMLASLALPRLLDMFPSVLEALGNVVLLFVNTNSNQGILWMGLIVFILMGLTVNWITFRNIAVTNQA